MEIRYGDGKYLNLSKFTRMKIPRVIVSVIPTVYLSLETIDNGSGWFWIVDLENRAYFNRDYTFTIWATS